MRDERRPKVETILRYHPIVLRRTQIHDVYTCRRSDVRAIEMHGYSDYSVVAPATRGTAAGISHAHGSNTKLPQQWLLYVKITDLVVSNRERMASGAAAVLCEPGRVESAERADPK